MYIIVINDTNKNMAYNRIFTILILIFGIFGIFCIKFNPNKAIDNNNRKILTIAIFFQECLFVELEIDVGVGVVESVDEDEGVVEGVVEVEGVDEDEGVVVAVVVDEDEGVDEGFCVDEGVCNDERVSDNEGITDDEFGNDVDDFCDVSDVEFILTFLMQ